MNYFNISGSAFAVVNYNNPALRIRAFSTTGFEILATKILRDATLRNMTRGEYNPNSDALISDPIASDIYRTLVDFVRSPNMSTLYSGSDPTFMLEMIYILGNGDIAGFLTILGRFYESGLVDRILLYILLSICL